MNGLALIIIVGQLPKLCGFSTDAEGFGNEVEASFSGSTRPLGRRCGPGSGCWLSFGAYRLTKAVPAVLVGVVGATVVSAVLDLTAHGVSTVGTLPGGCPTPSVPWTKWADVGPLMVAAVGITLVSLADTIATSSSFGARRGEEVDPNQEMIGIGAANLAADSSRVSPCRPADHGPRSWNRPGQSPNSPPWSVPESWWRCCCSSTPCWPTSPSPLWRPY